MCIFYDDFEINKLRNFQSSPVVKHTTRQRQMHTSFSSFSLSIPFSRKFFSIFCFSPCIISVSFCCQHNILVLPVVFNKKQHTSICTFYLKGTSAVHMRYTREKNKNYEVPVHSFQNMSNFCRISSET